MALAVILACTCASNAAAHEIGKTRVIVTFRPDGTYRIDVLVDPDALVARLEALAGELPPPAASLKTRPTPERLQTLVPPFLSGVTVTFDGVAAQPTFRYLPGSGDPVRDPITGALTYPPGVVRLEGSTPPHAKTFGWSYRFVYGSYALTLNGPTGRPPVTQWLLGGQISDPFSLEGPLARASRFDIARQYLVLGFTHILPKGVDHILFVVGLFLLSTRWRPLLMQVSAFTLAHSITLGLTIYGVLSLPSTIVEPLIALSIAYVAIENLVTSQLKPWRIALVFGFGLLHGMGFAGVLRELGLPRSEFLTALVTFNLGVEAGQLSVIALAFGAFAYWHGRSALYRRWVLIPSSLAIAATGLFWTVQRITVVSH